MLTLFFALTWKQSFIFGLTGVTFINTHCTHIYNTLQETHTLHCTTVTQMVHLSLTTQLRETHKCCECMQSELLTFSMQKHLYCYVILYLTQMCPFFVHTNCKWPLVYGHYLSITPLQYWLC